MIKNWIRKLICIIWSGHVYEESKILWTPYLPNEMPTTYVKTGYACKKCGDVWSMRISGTQQSLEA